jgi:SlyX protein
MAEDTRDLEVRLIELEMRLAFQDDTVQKLNDVITRQQQQIDRLAREVAALRSQLFVLAPSLTAAVTDESPPPHY